MKAGKRKWLKPGAKVVVRGDDCWQGDREGEVLKIERDQRGTRILVRVTEEFWVNKDEVEEG